MFPPLARKLGLLSDRLNNGFNFADRDKPQQMIVCQVDKSGRNFHCGPAGGHRSISNTGERAMQCELATEMPVGMIFADEGGGGEYRSFLNCSDIRRHGQSSFGPSPPKRRAWLRRQTW